MLNNVWINVVITSRLFGIVTMHYVNSVGQIGVQKKLVGWIVIYIMCRVMFCLN